MSVTKEKLRKLPRPVREVALPGGGTVHVRSLTLGELKQVDRAAEELPAGPEREVRRVELLAAYALAEPDGTATFGDVTSEDLDDVGQLTPDQLRAIVDAAVPSRDAQKN